MKTGQLSADQAAAIERYRKENNVVLILSGLTNGKVSFRKKNDTTNSIIEKDIKDLVYDHKVAKLEESKTRAEEKRREEREAKWKPTTGQY